MPKESGGSDGADGAGSFPIKLIFLGVCGGRGGWNGCRKFAGGDGTNGSTGRGPDGGHWEKNEGGGGGGDGSGQNSLWVFIIPYILPGFTSFGLINLFQFLSMALRLILLSRYVLILSSNVLVGSLFKGVNELLFIWCWTFSQYLLLNKTNLEPISWTLIVWSFKIRNSCKVFHSSIERLLRIPW